MFLRRNDTLTFYRVHGRYIVSPDLHIGGKQQVTMTPDSVRIGMFLRNSSLVSEERKKS